MECGGRTFCKANVSNLDQLYKYDANGRRVWKETNEIIDTVPTTTKTVYVYHGPNVIAEYAEGAAATTPGNDYVYANGIDSLAMVVHNNDAKGPCCEFKCKQN